MNITNTFIKNKWYLCITQSWLLKQENNFIRIENLFSWKKYFPSKFLFNYFLTLKRDGFLNMRALNSFLGLLRNRHWHRVIQLHDFRSWPQSCCIKMAFLSRKIPMRRLKLLEMRRRSSRIYAKGLRKAICKIYIGRTKKVSGICRAS